MRPTRRFNALSVPKTLQAALPFKSKPKLTIGKKGIDGKGKGKVGKTYLAKRAVVAEPEERRASTLMQQLHTMHNQREVKRKQKATERRVGNAKKRALENREVEGLAKRARKKRFVKQGQEDKKRSAAGGRGAGAGD